MPCAAFKREGSDQVLRDQARRSKGIQSQPCGKNSQPNPKQSEVEEANETVNTSAHILQAKGLAVSSQRGK
jgi:hypothetical protein